MLAGCGILTLKAAPTALPPYLHYTPSDGFNVHLEFDYPSSWLLEEHNKTYYSTLFLGEPRFLIAPTQAPGESHIASNDFGYISILFLPVKPGQTPDAEIALRKQNYSKQKQSVTNWVTLLNDYRIKIDGYDASILEYQTNDPEHSPSLMFNRSAFFTVKDQFYEVFFSVAEKERGGEFEKGYEYFLNSLKIVP